MRFPDERLAEDGKAGVYQNGIFPPRRAEMRSPLAGLLSVRERQL